MTNWRRVPLGGLTLIVIIASTLAASTPPKIKSRSREVIAYRLGESVELPCVAIGDPKPRYEWRLNNKPFDVNGLAGRLTQQPDSGTIVFNRPLKMDEGVYQCFATNEYGTAASLRTILIVAVLQPFKDTSLKTYRVQIGKALSIPCASPKSFPPADMFWAVVSETTGFKQLILNNRVTMDQEGALYFTNVKKSDQLPDGSKYVCVADNTVLRTFVQGADSRIIVEGSEPERSTPKRLWTTPSTEWKAVAGKPFKLKCIFSGQPTPKVSWFKTDGTMPGKPEVYYESYGQEMIFRHIKVKDSGTYQCRGQNELGSVPESFSYTVKVEEAPFWITKPSDQIMAETESASFICRAGGRPQPTIKWFINGVPINQSPPNNRRLVRGHNITYVNLSKTDAQVLQCNASNNHGYVFANAYLNVLAEPPSFTLPPARKSKVAEGQEITITCQTFGAPKAKVSWFKEGTPLTGGRYLVQSSGDLVIQNVVATDAGNYTCIAKNKFGKVSNWGMVQVRQRTTIQTKPQDIKIIAGEEAKFVCTATTDPEEIGNLQVNWKKDDDFINYQLVQRVFKNTLDDSLTISGTIVSDTGRYTCVASNGLDSVEAKAYLTVQDRPRPPIVDFVDCQTYKKENQALIKWKPDGDNYAPILEYIVQYNTTFTPDQWTTMSPANNPDYNTPEGNQRTEMLVQLSPFANYTFRVIAKNRIGPSPPSKHSSKTCRTLEDVPDQNPKFVRGEGDQPRNMIIMWSPMPMIDRNGVGFYYEVEWKCIDNLEKCDPALNNNNENLERIVKVTDMLNKGRYVVDNLPTYTKFEITVRAGNSRGQSRVTPPIVIGFSGEDEPSEKVQNFRLDLSFPVTDRKAKFIWNKVDPSPDKVKGFFVGYRVQYYRQSDPADKRYTDIIINKPQSFSGRNKRAVDSNLEERIIEDLPPYSTVIVTVMVRNKRYTGPPSDPVTVETKEGKPGPVIGFQSLSRNANTLTFKWNKPEEPNGILIGYSLYYQKVNGLDVEYRELADNINDPNILTGRISGLRPEQTYRVFIAARTKVGTGAETFLDVPTTPTGPPNPPSFSIMDVGESYVNVSWTPSRTGNPGSVFYTQYRKKGSSVWLNTAAETMRNWINVTGLDPGVAYQVRVIARNGQNEEAPSDLQEITLLGYSASTASIGTATWFIILLVLLALLIILVIVVCFIQRNRGGKYPDTNATITT